MCITLAALSFSAWRIIVQRTEMCVFTGLSPTHTDRGESFFSAMPIHRQDVMTTRELWDKWNSSYSTEMGHVSDGLHSETEFIPDFTIWDSVSLSDPLNTELCPSTRQQKCLSDLDENPWVRVTPITFLWVFDLWPHRTVKGNRNRGSLMHGEF